MEALVEFMPTKGIEYLLVLGYLAIFIPFWKLFFSSAGDRRPAPSPVPRAAAVVPRLPLGDMFRVPDGVWIHPAHTWARQAAGRRVSVGIDDFARQLVGPVAGVSVPALGAELTQGMPAATLWADSKRVDVLSPVSGRVTALNPALADQADPLNADPFGAGWLFEVDAPRFDDDARQLLAGASAAHLQSAAWEDLSRLLTPGLGTIMHDGGAPLDGFARAIDGAGWDGVARRFLRS